MVKNNYKLFIKNMNNLSVSIVTVSQLNRFDSIKLLCKMVNYQDYENIIEWIIIEGSEKKEDGIANEMNINSLNCKVPIKYFGWTGKKLGGLRQLSNDRSIGQIIVCMDDDDFYPTTRVSHAVDVLKHSPYEIAGTGRLLCYDFVLTKFLLYENHENKNHLTNNVMAYKRSYLQNHKYNVTRTNAEETDFTNNFTENIAQLDTYKSIIIVSHKYNTYNKREIFIGGLANFNKNSTVEELNKNIYEIIPIDIFEDMRKIYSINSSKEYFDIIYFTGGFCKKWDPSSESLGGSEQAVVYLSTEWIKLGKKVCVYGNFDKDKEINGVVYRKWQNFDYNKEYNVVILWRIYGFLSSAPIGIKCKHLYLDLHDNMKLNNQFINLWNKYKSFSNQIKLVFFKSEFHKNEFCNMIQNVEHRIIMNGVRNDIFGENKYDVTRDKYRFCYCSAYTRGLLDILNSIWPQIYKEEPRAELHIYYGLPEKLQENEKHMSTINKLLSQPGVMDHGRQSAEIIAREKYRSNFHIYLSVSDEEIDCISIRESCLTGCIPIISNYGVFRERLGYHINYDPKNKQTCSHAIKQIITLMKKDEITEKIRTVLPKSPMVTNWNEVAKEWLPYL
jgi:hypothetical protein